jgi:hypothetical protein
MGNLSFSGTGPGAGLKLNFTNSPGAAGQFIDSAATNRTQQFYKVTSP